VPWHRFGIDFGKHLPKRCQGTALQGDAQIKLLDASGLGDYKLENTILTLAVPEYFAD
jgi:hypothetical protein